MILPVMEAPVSRSAGRCEGEMCALKLWHFCSPRAANSWLPNFRQKVPIRIDFCSINMSGAVAALFALSTLAQAYVGGAVLEHLTG